MGGGKYQLWQTTKIRERPSASLEGCCVEKETSSTLAQTGEKGETWSLEKKALRTGYYHKNYRKTCFRIPDMLFQSNIQICAHLKTHPGQDPYIKNKTNRKKEICVWIPKLSQLKVSLWLETWQATVSPCCSGCVCFNVILMSQDGGS